MSTRLHVVSQAWTILERLERSAEKRSQQAQISMGQNVLSMVGVSVLNLIHAAQVVHLMCELLISK